MSGQNSKMLTAQYEDPTGQNRTFESSIDSDSADLTGTAEKTQYLEKLRAATINLQAEINQYLTQRMDADNLRNNATAQDAEEAKAENNYGEEEAEG